NCCSYPIRPLPPSPPLRTRTSPPACDHALPAMQFRIALGVSSYGVTIELGRALDAQRRSNRQKSHFPQSKYAPYQCQRNAWWSVFRRPDTIDPNDRLIPPAASRRIRAVPAWPNEKANTPCWRGSTNLRPPPNPRRWWSPPDRRWQSRQPIRTTSPARRC